MKKLSIVAVICIIAMLFASCSGSTPAPTEPNDIQKSAVLSIISEAARADYEGATTLLINGEDASQMTPEELKAAIIGGILNGLKVSATVNKDFAEGTSTLITSGNINISAEANLSVTFGDKDTEGAIEIPHEVQSL